MSNTPKMEIPGTIGVRNDLPRRRPAVPKLPPCIRDGSCGVVVMSHRGFSNGRLSVCLSSLPENFPVTVVSDSIEPADVERDRYVAEFHGARFHHSTPWGGRAQNALSCMAATDWQYTLYLCDDVWLFPETATEMFRWSSIFHQNNIPMACLCAPRFETYHEHKEYGFATWGECLAQPWRFESLPPPVQFQCGPGLYTNPFGACMVVYRPAYEDLGGFAPEYWAHDDVFNHRVWLSGRWVNCCYPGRGFVHLGAQSWHDGEGAEWVGTFEAATGISAAESGRLQTEKKIEWAARLRDNFARLGGEAAL